MSEAGNAIVEAAQRPRLTIDLTPQAAKSLAEAKPGLPIKLLVTGVVTSISLYAEDSGEVNQPGYSGHMSIEIASARMQRDTKNAVADMFYEDTESEAGED